MLCYVWVYQGFSSPWNTPLHASEFVDNPDCDDLVMSDENATHATHAADSVHGRCGFIGKLLSLRVLTFPLGFWLREAMLLMGPTCQSLITVDPFGHGNWCCCEKRHLLPTFEC